MFDSWGQPQIDSGAGLLRVTDECILMRDTDGYAWLAIPFTGITSVARSLVDAALSDLGLTLDPFGGEYAVGDYAIVYCAEIE